MRQFYVIHKEWVSKQPWHCKTVIDSVPSDCECVGSTVETAEEAAAEETVTINGKTYTKSELKKLLE